MPKYGIGVTESQSYFIYVEAKDLDTAIETAHNMPLDEIKSKVVEYNQNRVVDTITDSIDDENDLESVERYTTQSSF